jgi:hypothetical protein
MKIHKIYIAIGLIIAFGLFFELAAHADEANQETKITFNAPIQIPGRVLPAGTYTLQRLDNDDLNLVQIFNADGSVLYATLQTVPVEREDATDDAAVTLAEETSQPDVLVNWFYPGSLTGHEFVYPRKQEQKLAQDSHETIFANQTTFSAEGAGE